MNTEKMKDSMKKIFSYCFDKWWILPLYSVLLIGLSFIFDSILFLLISLLLITVSAIYQFIKKEWKIGCLSGAVMFVILCLSALWIIFQLFPSPEKIQREYSSRYENRYKIQKIIGMKIPDFKIVDSQLTHLSEYDFEINVQRTIEFKTIPDDNFFLTLDRICRLSVPQKPKKNSKYFYYGLERIHRCWSKDGNKYKYMRNTDFGGKVLHSTDAYFNFEITKGSKTAKIEYGNY